MCHDSFLIIVNYDLLPPLSAIPFVHTTVITMASFCAPTEKLINWPKNKRTLYCY